MNTQALERILHPTAHRPPLIVKPGMRYKQVEELGRTWVVKRKLEAKSAAFPHVMIACEDFEMETRVIAESALTDTHFFRYLPEARPKVKEPPESKSKAKKPAAKQTAKRRKAKKKA